VPKLEDPKGKAANRSDPAAKGKGFKLEDIASREVRAILFDTEQNKFISNTYVLPTSCSADGKTWKFSFSGCKSIELARKFCVKHERDATSTRKNVELLFELVLTIKPKATSNKSKSSSQQYQVTNGWGSIALAAMF